MKPHSRSGNWITTWVLLSVVATIAACGTISPRRIVSNNPSVSPSPTETPAISPTPTVTPTPTPMGAVVPNEFLFTANPNDGLVFGFKINRDGGLSPVPGSPFVAFDSPRLVAALGDNLLVVGNATLTAFAVDKETGAIKKADAAALQSISSLVAQPASGTVFGDTAAGQVMIRMVNNKIRLSPVSGGTESSVEPQGMSRTNVTDATGKFTFVLDHSTGNISAFTAQDGARVVPAGSYSAGHGASSMTIAVP